MKSFYKLLGNVLIAAVTNNYVWFALTFWVYLETRSMLATSVIAGIFSVNTAVSGFWFGSIVDHNKKKFAMLISSIATLVLFSAGFLLYLTAPEGALRDISGVWLWSLVLLLMFGVTAGNIRNIALPTTVTILVPEDKRDRANGMSGTVLGVAFAITSFGSGLVLANGGMRWVLVSAIVLTVIAIVHLALISIPEKEIVHSQENPKQMDIRGTISAIRAIPDTAQIMPTPEQKKLAVFLGRWHTLGEVAATASTPAAKVDADGSVGGNDTKSIENMGYEPERQCYFAPFFDSTGGSGTEEIRLDGNTWTWPGSNVIDPADRKSRTPRR